MGDRTTEGRETETQESGPHLQPAFFWCLVCHRRCGVQAGAESDASSSRLTCAATTFQPLGNRTQVCIWRPTLPGKVFRWNNVDATAKSRPYVVMTVFEIVRIS